MFSLNCSCTCLHKLSIVPELLYYLSSRLIVIMLLSCFMSYTGFINYSPSAWRSRKIMLLGQMEIPKFV